MAVAAAGDTGFSRTVLVLWGIIALVVGFFLLFRPGITALVCVEIMAIAWIIGGIFDFIGAIAERGHYWGWRIVGSIIGILAGIYIVAHPALGTVFTLTIAFIFIAIAALINGIFNIFAGFKNEGGTSWASVIIGLLQIVVGIWFIMNPVTGALLLVPVLGIFLILAGIFAIIATFFLGKSSATPTQPSEPA
jgi:uncharacterized membrane protein HdeD (DUF308 family)